jgi:hypothetical protein
VPVDVLGHADRGVPEEVADFMKGYSLSEQEGCCGVTTYVRVAARNLNDNAVSTAHGGSRWYPSTVRAVVLANLVK